MDNNNGVVPLTVAAIGETLKKAREKKLLTIEQVQKQTHIHSSVVAALEEGRCDEILTPTYVKSFLKKYAGFLGLDSKELLSEYSKLSYDQFGQEVSAGRVEQDPQALLKTVVISGIIVIFVVFTILLGIAIKKITPALKKRKAVITSTAQTKNKAASRKAAAIAAVSPRRDESSAKKASFNLTIKVNKNVYVKLKKDRDLIFERVLSRGSAESFKVNEKIELYVAKAEAIELILDGKSIGSPGKGIIKNLEVTKKGMRVR